MRDKIALVKQGEEQVEWTKKNCMIDVETSHDDGKRDERCR